ncbi:DUF2637 domain-containing protein [Streptomyces sp. NPDC096176]|uniref:DUF2637 domain-containing protein n=1 Tax=Streptomyces sp. NPDC096176 TaxID=3366079 RepID=UPI0038085D66
MHDEYSSFGSAVSHPDMGGYRGWEDPYGLSPANMLSTHEPMAPLGLEILDAPWDPTAELQQLLQPPVGQEFPTAFSGYGSAPGPGDRSTLTDLSGVTAELPHVRPTPGHRRRASSPKPRFILLQTISFSIAVLAAVIVSGVSIFGGMVALDPLRQVAASRTSQGLMSWWPVLVYGPWMVASLTILRASLHRRRAVQSWIVVLFFSALATWLCVTEAAGSLTDVAAAALPSLAALACFQQLVRLVSQARPPRRASARHRLRVPSRPFVPPTPESRVC